MNRARRGTYRGSHGQGRGIRQTTSYRDILTSEATTISVEDKDFSQWTEFMPLKELRPHLPMNNLAELDLLQLYRTDEVLEQFVKATNAYAEAKKATKRAMYTTIFHNLNFSHRNIECLPADSYRTEGSIIQSSHGCLWFS